MLDFYKHIKHTSATSNDSDIQHISISTDRQTQHTPAAATTDSSGDITHMVRYIHLRLQVKVSCIHKISWAHHQFVIHTCLQCNRSVDPLITLENTSANNVLSHQCSNYILSTSTNINKRGLIIWSCAINVKEATTLFITHLAHLSA